jgi:hypothetical protein
MIHLRYNGLPIMIALFSDNGKSFLGGAMLKHLSKGGRKDLVGANIAGMLREPGYCGRNAARPAQVEDCLSGKPDVERAARVPQTSGGSKTAG